MDGWFQMRGRLKTASAILLITLTLISLTALSEVVTAQPLPQVTVEHRTTLEKEGSGSILLNSSITVSNPSTSSPLNLPEFIVGYPLETAN
ncbi:MAG: hypothetical protein ACE5GD_04460, partial [Candidatus Geothermarchaeales archaeon]